MISTTQKLLNSRNSSDRKSSRTGGKSAFPHRNYSVSSRSGRVMDVVNRGLDLERELTCSICTEVLYAPQTLLDCLHTFCGSCLKEWFSWQNSSRQNAHSSTTPGTMPFTCPSCRAPVRDTKHNSTVTTLLEMFLTANPDKCRRAEELEELKKIYRRGDSLIPKITREDSGKVLQERRAEDIDRSLIDEVREMSLQEALTRAPETGRERHRRAEEDHHMSAPLRSRNTILEIRVPDERIRVRRQRREDRQPRERRINSFESNEIVLRRRRRSGSDEDRSSHVEIQGRPANRQIDHQSSLRSLISSTDTDSVEMEEEILRQIREEGLLDGIDIENIDVNQEDQISERIAEAFRRRQNERFRYELAQRNSLSQSRGRNRLSSEFPETLTENSPGETPQTVPKTPSNQNRISPSTDQSSLQKRVPLHPPTTIKTMRPRAESMDGGSRRRLRRTVGINQSLTFSVPSVRVPARPNTRSALDLRDKSESLFSTTNWSKISQSSRSSIDLTTPNPVESTKSEIRPLRTSANSGFQHSPTLGTPASHASSERNPYRKTKINTSLNLPSLLNTSIDRSLMPAPLSSHQSISERANVLSNGSIPISPYNRVKRNRSSFFTEPLINCSRCGRDHIEYELHYNCKICSRGHFNVCISCYRSGRGCQHWLGVGQTAWNRWEALKQTSDPDVEKPHILTPSRYLPPKIIPGGADGRRTLTTEDPRKRLQSGTFCANCYAWTNECYWRCDICNDGDWGFCNNCVNQGHCCTHPILPLSYNVIENDSPQRSQTHGYERPAAAQIMTGPDAIDSGPFKPLTFSTRCDICRYPIQPSQTRYHCFSCKSSTSDNLPGNYDICTNCYPKLVWSRRISIENGPSGWRRCLKGHRMVIVGFLDKNGGQRRHLVNDQVGGKCLRQKPCTTPEIAEKGLQVWSWGDGLHVRGDDSHYKLVTTDVQKSPPSNSGSLKKNSNSSFPADGGVGKKAIAIWGWFPASNLDDELLFPRGAEIRECKDVNGDWFHGTYMGRQGLFPSNYVRILDPRSPTLR
ncbi:putative ring finger domain-containing protein [Golovinomyces cichoracearum]|uniref:Putative ring finger domain-containing protein n=1 Tax=Golovinomyces cichoracearum TaxID=62708 RepID=A0A420IB06_9PEZI|nr:putative ring finger domain-containing protein [Golovinomyces cichoracearum]